MIYKNNEIKEMSIKMDWKMNEFMNLLIKWWNICIYSWRVKLEESCLYKYLKCARLLTDSTKMCNYFKYIRKIKLLHHVLKYNLKTQNSQKKISKQVSVVKINSYLYIFVYVYWTNDCIIINNFHHKSS